MVLLTAHGFRGVLVFFPKFSRARLVPLREILLQRFVDTFADLLCRIDLFVKP